MNVDVYVGNVWVSTTASLWVTEARQGFGGWLKSEKKKQTTNSFFPDGHCKIEQNILSKFVEAESAWSMTSHFEQNHCCLMENGFIYIEKQNS